MGDNPTERHYRADWDQRARQGMRLYVATWYAKSDETWEEGARRDAEFILRLLPAELGPGQACLDLGCGPGRLLPYLAQRFSSVEGCDVSPEMLASARELVGPEIPLHLVDGSSLDGLPDDGFGCVICCAVFIHLDQATIRSYLAEVVRVLTPGGVLAASFNSSEVASPVDPDAYQPGPPLPPPDIGEEDMQLIGGPTWEGARFDRPALEQLLHAAGLQLLDCSQQGEAWLLAARLSSS